MHGEFVSLKQRPVTSRAVFYRINSALPEVLRLCKPDKHLSLALQQLSPWFSHYNPSNSTKSTSPCFYIGGIVAVHLSKMAATMIGTTSLRNVDAFTVMDAPSNKSRCFPDKDSMTKKTFRRMAYSRHLKQMYTKFWRKHANKKSTWSDLFRIILLRTLAFVKLIFWCEI